MPRAPQTCVMSGCPNAASPGNPRCDTHRLSYQRQADAQRPTARQRGYDTAWEATRNAYLKAHPNCVICNQPAQHVDHIEGRGPLAPDGHDWNQLQSLCHSCHSRKTAAQDGSFGRQKP